MLCIDAFHLIILIRALLAISYNKEGKECKTKTNTVNDRAAWMRPSMKEPETILNEKLVEVMRSRV
jgi:hypothetical protein